MSEAGFRGVVQGQVQMLAAGALAALLVGSVAGQLRAATVAPVAAERFAGPLIRAVALGGDRVLGGRLETLATARIDRGGEVAVAGTLVRGRDRRLALLALARGRVIPVVQEGDETGRGPLLVPDRFASLEWNEGTRAAFVGAIDQNRNGVFDAGVDPAALFLANPGQLRRLLATGDRLDGGVVLAIRSFHLNALGDVAVLVEIDRNGDGVFTAGVDQAGIYRLSDGRAAALVREGDRLAGERVSGLDHLAPQEWQFNDRSEVALVATLERPEIRSAPTDAVLLIGPGGTQVVARLDGRRGAGPFLRLVLDNAGGVTFATPLLPSFGQPVRLFRRAARLGTRVEELAAPGLFGPDGTPVGQLLPLVATNDTGSVGFLGVFDQPAAGLEPAIENPAAAFIRAPEFLYEVVREGGFSPWGPVARIDNLLLNNRSQGVVQTRVVPAPLDEGALFDVAGAILFWQNGVRSGVVGPGDPLPGGRAQADAGLLGISDLGEVLFVATVRDDFGVPRVGFFLAEMVS